MMRSSRLITIFSEVPSQGSEPSGLLVSAGLHVFVFGALISGLKTTVREPDAAVRQYSVRTLELNRAEPQRRRTLDGGPPRTAVGQVAKPRGVESARTSDEGAHEEPASVALTAGAAPDLLPAKLHAPQTLVQPDVSRPVLMTRALPLPTIVIWNVEHPQVKVIVPEPAREVTSARVLPSRNAPNREVRPADLQLSASAFAVKTPMLPSSTSSPMAINIDVATTHVPVTSSTIVGQPTGAMVMSISDLRQNEGTVVLPGANQSAVQSAQGGTGTGMAATTPQGGKSAATSEAKGKGPSAGGMETDASGAVVAVGKKGAAGGSQEPAGTGLAGAGEVGLTRINLPKDGQFGAVVVGSSLAEQYPESVGIWNSRLAYTVYLHVGLSRNWILQYALPAEATKGATMTRPEAPWPFTMVRPQAATAGLNADAIMIHGFVNVLGKFDGMSVVFPAELPERKVLLSALQQWQFRPARENGQLTPVEVLLIIPEELQ